MLVYHRTVAAEFVLEEGFKDQEDTYLTYEIHSGVWLSDGPLTINEGAKGDTVLVLDVPEKVLLEYEWVEDEELAEDGVTWVASTCKKPYRELLVPAEVANRYGPPKIHEHDYAGWTEEDILSKAEWLESLNRKHEKAMADRLRQVTIPFLKRHGLLGDPEER